MTPPVVPAMVAALTVSGLALGVTPLPAFYVEPDQTRAVAAYQFRMADDGDPHLSPLTRRGWRPWRVTRPNPAVQVFTTTKTTVRVKSRIRFVKHAGPAWDRVHILVTERGR